MLQLRIKFQKSSVFELTYNYQTFTTHLHVLLCQMLTVQFINNATNLPVFLSFKNDKLSKGYLGLSSK